MTRSPCGCTGTGTSAGLGLVGGVRVTATGAGGGVTWLSRSRMTRCPSLRFDFVPSGWKLRTHVHALMAKDARCTSIKLITAFLGFTLARWTNG